MTFAPLRNFLAAFSIALVVGACGGARETIEGPPPIVPTSLVAVPRAVNTVAIGSVLDFEAVVTLRDQNGAGIPNVWIRWAPTAGTVANDSSKTDANGSASSGAWKMGTVSGTQTLTASAAGLSVVAMSAKVLPDVFAGLISASPSISGVVNTTLTVPASVKAVDKYGNGVPGIFVQFSMWSGDGTITGPRQPSDENGIASVGSWKLGPVAGQQTIRADDHITGATTMVHATALPAPPSQIVVVDGNAQTGQSGKRLCTSPVIAVRDQYGNGISQVPIVFTPGAGSGTVTNGTVLTNSEGLATVGTWILSGSATQTLVATSPAAPALTATFTATIAPPTGYLVCSRFVGTGGTPRQRQAVATAIARWQRVITGPVQSTPIVENANRCFPGAPALNETVEGLLLFVQISHLDGPGNAVARAGPCTVHIPSILTQMGLLQLDSTDLDLLLAQGTLDNMVTHEMGHVLGFGTLWVSKNLLTGAGTADPIFTGASARAQFAAIPSSYSGNTVPVENVGEIGTRDTHWRRTVFGNELMQGFSFPVMPMSRVTVGSLGDLGYDVDLSKADAFSLPAAQRASSMPERALSNDVLDVDLWGTDRHGRRQLLRSARNPLVRRAAK